MDPLGRRLDAVGRHQEVSSFRLQDHCFRHPTSTPSVSQAWRKKESKRNDTFVETSSAPDMRRGSTKWYRPRSAIKTTHTHAHTSIYIYIYIHLQKGIKQHAHTHTHKTHAHTTDTMQNYPSKHRKQRIVTQTLRRSSASPGNFDIAPTCFVFVFVPVSRASSTTRAAGLDPKGLLACKAEPGTLETLNEKLGEC